MADKVSRQQIQVAIEGGNIKFDDSKKPMKVDGNPFPVNMLHTSGRIVDGGEESKLSDKFGQNYQQVQ